MPSAYTNIDLAKPDGSTQAGTAHSASARANLIALAVGIAAGELEGFVYSQTVGAGDALRPDQEFWKSGANWVRVTNTWGTSSGADGNPTQRVIEWSTDSGSSWASVATQTATYAADGSLTATSGAASFSSRLMMLWGWIKKIAAHIAATGTSVHGLASMAIQAASAVVITGGTAALTYIREGVVNLGATLTGSTPVDWNAGGYFYGTVTGSGAAFTWSNLPSGKAGYITLEIVNPGTATTLFPGGTKYIGAAPVYSTAGTYIFSLGCRDGSTVTILGFGMRS